MKATRVDLAVIGAGPAGLAAAVAAKERGIDDVVILERDERPGGILPQCIHNGFGLEKFSEELTGPEYARRYINMARDHDLDIELKTMVLDLEQDRTITTSSGGRGLRTYQCRSIVLAMGCRERPRGAIGLPGTRPAGVFTAGHAQRLINVEGYMPGRQVVILGSGDIGMIMARRLTLEGAEVKRVVEVMPYTNGLIRNEVQCLHDFGIPLQLNHTVAEIHGDDRVEAVTVVRVDSAGKPVPGTEERIDCDTLLLSVGLIPENELSKMAGIAIDRRTGGPRVNELLQTNVEGIFCCGNVLHVNDVVDRVSAEGEIAAEGAWRRIRDHRTPSRPVLSINPDDKTVHQVVPHTIETERATTLSVRVTRPMGRMTLRVGDIHRQSFPYGRPGEMIWVDLPGEVVARLRSGGRDVTLSCEER